MIMCLAIPGQVVEMSDPGHHLARVDIGGMRRQVNVMLVDPEGLEIGDWVLVHVGFALNKVDEEEAHETLRLLREMGEAYDRDLAELAASAVRDEVAA